MASDGESVAPLSGRAFFISPIGTEGSDVRVRSDDILGLIGEVVAEHGISVVRADQIDEPGMVTTQIIREILQAPMVLADLTAANANVYYELGIAHSFERPVITMIDKARDLTFDTAHDRAIIIGDSGRLTMGEGRLLKSRLTQFANSVASNSYVPGNVVSQAAGRVALLPQSDEDPVHVLLGKILDSVEGLGEALESKASASEPSGTDAELLRAFVADMLSEWPVELGRLRNGLLNGRTSEGHDAWVRDMMAIVERTAT